MEKIRLISTSIIQPFPGQIVSSTDGHRIELTPWDLQLLPFGYSQKGLLFLKPTELKEDKESKSLANLVVEHLKLTLTRTLEFFPPLTGRLGITKNDGDNTSSFFIDCNNAGAHFIHAVSDNISVSDIIGPVHVPRVVDSFFPMNGVVNYEGTSKPLLAVQLTELVDGYFLGCTINHVVVDGTSSLHFLNSWSEIWRGFDKPSQPPFLERWFPGDISYPIHVPLRLEQLGGEKNPTLSPQPAEEFEERIFHFTREKIVALKAKANAEMGTVKISSLQALLAHLWRGVVRCKGVANDKEVVKFILTIGARPRLGASVLPAGYFGNAIHVETVQTTAGEMLGRGLGWTAWQMNMAIDSQTEEEIGNFLKGWVKNPKFLTSGNMGSKNTLSISSSPQFDVYANDFGWVKLVAVRTGRTNKCEGKITVFQGVEEGSIDVGVCLSAEKLFALGDDKEFMEAVTV